MDVILLKDVDHVGLRGDVVSVAGGYARNYLLPRKLAEAATPAKVAELKRRDTIRARHEARNADEARSIAATIERSSLRFDVKAGPGGALFGSVTATNVADELWEQAKVRIDRRKVDLHDPIKRVGRYRIGIDVFQGVRAELETLVVPEGGELPAEEPEAVEEPVAEAAADSEAETETEAPAGAAVDDEPEA